MKFLFPVRLPVLLACAVSFLTLTTSSSALWPFSGKKDKVVPADSERDSQELAAAAMLAQGRDAEVDGKTGRAQGIYQSIVKSYPFTKSAAEALAHPKIEVIWNSEPRAFLGENQLEKLRIENVKTKEVRELATDGVFVFVGYVPRTDLVKGLVKMNEWGYVETGEDMSTNVPGVYVAGDIRSKRFRQITTAVADGTIAALAVQKFVKDQQRVAA